MDNKKDIGQINPHANVYGPPVIENSYEPDNNRIKPDVTPFTPRPSVYGPPPIFRKVSIIDKIKNLFKKNKSNW